MSEVSVKFLNSGVVCDVYNGTEMSFACKAVNGLKLNVICAIEIFGDICFLRPTSTDGKRLMSKLRLLSGALGEKESTVSALSKNYSKVQ